VNRKIGFVLIILVIGFSLGCQQMKVAEQTAQATETNIQKIRDGFTAFNNRDWSFWENLLSDNATSSDPMMPQPLMGKAAILQYNKQMIEVMPDAKGVIKNIYGGPNHVVVEAVFSGTMQKPMPGMPETVVGKTFQMPALQFLEFQGGKVTREIISYDTWVVMKQLGLMPESPPPSK